MNFTLHPGQTVAVVGASGSGKSTLVQLLMRYYDVENGEITLDGTDIRDLNIKWFRQQIGVVSQEPALFSSTIEENIRYGKEGASFSEVQEAAKLANAHNFIMKLPEGYETVVGQRGILLSGGQRQRIAIARALVSDPKILLLDEATSALDNISEGVVQRALDDASKGRTTLIIAHRLSTIRNADVIIAISDGQVAEIGSHDELMVMDGIYRRLVNSQIKATEDFDVTSDGDEAKLEDVDIQTVLKNYQRTLSRLSSTVSKHEEDERAETADILSHWSLKRLLGLTNKELPINVLGLIASFFLGGMVPAISIFMSEFMKDLAINDAQSMSNSINGIARNMVYVGVAIAVLRVVQCLCFGFAGGRITTRLRRMAFKALLRQETAYYDDGDNRVGAVITRLDKDTTGVQGATGEKVGYTLEAMSALLITLGIAFGFGWQLSLTVLPFFPLMAFCGIINNKISLKFAPGDRDAEEQAGQIATEAIDNIRTVAQLTMEGKLQAKYDGVYAKNYSDGVKRAHFLGFFQGLSINLILFSYAVTLSAGAFFTANGEMEFHNVFRIFIVLVYGGSHIGRLASSGQDYLKAKLAAGRLFRLLDRVPSVDSYSQEGKVPTTCRGDIDLKGLVFKYPSRPEVKVFRRLHLTIKSGEVVALVGFSGCGKSTITQLLERFYEAQKGTISLDGVNIEDLNISYLRSQIGIVSQEPNLFDCTIRENIEYGDNSRKFEMQEVISAARDANIHTFVESLPLGYNTPVGEKGTQLSGGQKQRVAIARALIRNPKVLLLDEATSALDSESEQIVQEALDRAQVGRTSIVIAHRLSTIQGADKIVVINNGKVQEQGTHPELMALEGLYYNLQLAQSRNK